MDVLSRIPAARKRTSGVILGNCTFPRIMRYPRAGLMKRLARAPSAVARSAMPSLHASRWRWLAARQSRTPDAEKAVLREYQKIGCGLSAPPHG